MFVVSGVCEAMRWGREEELCKESVGVAHRNGKCSLISSSDVYEVKGRAGLDASQQSRVDVLWFTEPRGAVCFNFKEGARLGDIYKG